MADRFQNYINGQWVNAKSGRTFENRNPANRNDLIGLFPWFKPKFVAPAANVAEDIRGAVAEFRRRVRVS